MNYVKTGQGRLPLITLIAILAISLTVNLPGLAITPLLGDLDKIFPEASKLKIQLLTVLPNFFIIPFVLYSGKLSVSKNKIAILLFGLGSFVLSGILYFFAKSLNELILISCLLGIGCGSVIPLDAGFIAEYFTGKYRMKQLGIKSGMANFTLIFATFFVGWLGNYGWHYPFLVYLIPILPLLLTPFLTPRFIKQYSKPEVITPPENKAASPSTNNPSASLAPSLNNFHFTGKKSLRLMVGIVALYFSIVYGCMEVSYYLPFTMQKYNWGSTEVGIVTSMFFLAITLPGFFLSFIIHVFRHFTAFVALLCMTIGLFLMGYKHDFSTYLLAVILVGFGYGVLQPIIYDKTTYIVPNPRKVTLYLAIVLAANNVAIVFTPFFVSLMELVLNIHADSFPYYLSGVIMAIIAFLSLIFIHSFIFRVDVSIFTKGINQYKTTDNQRIKTPKVDV